MKAIIIPIMKGFNPNFIANKLTTTSKGEVKIVNEIILLKLNSPINLFNIWFFVLSNILKLMLKKLTLYPLGNSSFK
jgi:hypothetical protein